MHWAHKICEKINLPAPIYGKCLSTACRLYQCLLVDHMDISSSRCKSPPKVSEPLIAPMQHGQFGSQQLHNKHRDSICQRSPDTRSRNQYESQKLFHLESWDRAVRNEDYEPSRNWFSDIIWGYLQYIQVTIYLRRLAGSTIQANWLSSHWATDSAKTWPQLWDICEWIRAPNLWMFKS